MEPSVKNKTTKKSIAKRSQTKKQTKGGKARYTLIKIKKIPTNFKTFSSNVNSQGQASGQMGANKVVRTVGKFKAILSGLRKRAGTGDSKYLNQKQLAIFDQGVYCSRKKAINNSISHTISLRNSLGRMKRVLKKSIYFSVFLKIIGPSISLMLYPLLGDFHIKQDGKGKLIWDSLLSIFVIVQVMITTIGISFSVQPHKVFYLGEREELFESYKLYSVFMILSTVLFTLNVFIGLHTSYYEKGEKITNSIKIRRKYLRNSIIFDLASNLPIYKATLSMLLEKLSDTDCVSQSPLGILLSLLILLKLKDIYNIMCKFEERFSLNETFEALFSLTKLMATMVLINHFIACFWFIIGDLGMDGNEASWLLGFPKMKWFASYTKALYWSITTLATVGYGDITPKSTNEIYFTMFVMLSGSTIFGYSISKVGNILENINRKNASARKDVKMIDRYLKKNNISDDLKTRIKKYIEFTYRQEGNFFSQAEDLLNKKLSPNLKEELLKESYRGFLESIPFLAKNFGEETLDKLVTIIKIRHFSPNEIIEKRGFGKNPSLFFILEGAVLVNFTGKQKEGSKKLLSIQSGECFGEYEFFTDQEKTLNYVSIGYSTIYYLEREDFISILKENRRDYQKFCEIRDRILLYREMASIDISCKFCEGPHLLSECPSIFYKPNRATTILRHLYSCDQKRRKAKTRRRNKQTSIHALSVFKKYNSAAQIFRTQNNSMFSDSVSDNGSQDAYPNSIDYEKPDNVWNPDDIPSNSEYEETSINIRRVPLLPAANFKSLSSLDNILIEREKKADSKEIEIDMHKSSQKSEAKDNLEIVTIGGNKKMKEDLNKIPRKSEEKSQSPEARSIDFYGSDTFHSPGPEHQPDPLNLFVDLRKAQERNHTVRNPDSRQKITSLEHIEFNFGNDKKKNSSQYVQQTSTHKQTLLKEKSLGSHEEKLLNIFRLGDFVADKSVFMREFETKRFELFSREYDAVSQFPDYFPHNNVNVISAWILKNSKHKKKGLRTSKYLFPKSKLSKSKKKFAGNPEI